MKVNLCALAALVAGLALAAPDKDAAAQAPGQIPAGYAYYNQGQDMYNYDPQMAPPPAGGMATASSACGCGSGACGGACGDSCGGAWSGSCDGSCSGSCGGGCGLMSKLFKSRMGNRKGQWFAGADFLYLRADVSEATAWLERDTSDTTAPLQFVDTFQQADFDYDGSYRFFGGYRFSDCCGEILLSYTRYSSESDMVSPEATTTRQFFGAFEVNAIEEGSQLTSDIDIDADIFDIDFARTLPLGSPLGECGSCQWCPAWDIKWFFGARYAEVDWTRDVVTTDTIAANSVNVSSRTQMSFNGAGPRFGIDGRRYIGRNGNFSVYAKGAVSLLLGDVDYVTTSLAATGDMPTQRASFTRIIPVTEIEAGGSIHLNSNITVTAGYMFSAWHDLGMGDQYFSTLTPVVYDDANILGFDGAFARAEIAY